ncbi:GGDEF domain-containing protein [Aquihabitans sp. G128]|uniref:GGDEF domain-containing protein n=1 Tax=Aquihabitans sp. G128 TaxID=2849779 RepID=UPI001C24382E|nr:GGDEF domain-containing protein [Aquihabitans sp. G128]QXC61093.1 GGDEF domain-containing protein [Aquihabitans sp. G128]
MEAATGSSWQQRGGHLAPFAALVVLAYGLAIFPPHTAHAVAVMAASGACFLAAGTLTVLVPWERLPDGSVLLPVALACAGVGLLRHAAGGGVSAYGGLLLLPVIWQALYGRRFELTATIALVATTYAVPILFIGGEPYPPGQWRAAIVSTLTAATVGFTVEHLNRTREELLARTRILAGHDELTGLVNRRHVSGVLADQVAGGTGGVLAMLDLDHFKEFNDVHGHLAGDDVLTATAEAWRGVVRATDTLARWGGEEFVVLFPDSSLDQACAILHRMAGAMGDGLTFSGGVVRLGPDEEPMDVLRAADHLLYEAKAEGRNRIITEDDTSVDRVDLSGLAGWEPAVLAALAARG